MNLRSRNNSVNRAAPCLASGLTAAEVLVIIAILLFLLIFFIPVVWRPPPHADGHSEINRWRDRRTADVTLNWKTLAAPISGATNEDILWLQNRTSAAVK